MLAVYLSPLYILANIFIVYRILKWTETCHSAFCRLPAKVIVTLTYAFFALSLVIAFFLPPGKLQRVMKLISNYWLAVLLFIVLVLLIACVGALIAAKLRKRKMSTKEHRIVGAVCLAVVAALFVYGAVHARQIKINNYEVTIEKDGGKFDDLRVVLVADLHMGYNIGCSQMAEMRDKINAEGADLVLIGGDIFDNEYEALDDPDQLAEILGGIESTYGTYAVYGNHDIQEKILAGFTFRSDSKKESAPEMDELLENAGIRLLRDESVLLDDSVYLYGRPDYERLGRGIEERKLPDELMADLDASKPVIVLDHEPREFSELAEAGVDLLLNGHTHDGQMFPGNLTCKLSWENSCGYMKVGGMHNIVTSGLGLFGPYLRIGTDAEICVIDVHFAA